MAIIAPDIGIDLGTSNTLVYVKHKGVVLNEPTLMVVTGGQKKSVKAFGEDARLMLGRTTGEYQSVRPLEDGVIKDYDMTEYMLEFFIRKAIGMSRLVRPRGLITIPSRVTAIERRAVREAAENAGIRKGALHLIEKPFAAALGSGLPVFEPRGSMVVDIRSFYEHVVQRLPLSQINDEWLLQTEGFSLNTRGSLRRLKRALDVLISLVLLIPATPVMLLTALIVRLESPGPVIYRQDRVGLYEKEFTVYKFRSMRADAEKNGAVWASAHDSRVTRFGKFIRKVRIDELPQIWNILKGDMSFIGPRPERMAFVTQLKKDIPYYSLRHTVKPGLTGWAQVCYPYGASEEDARRKLEYDLYYIKNMSILLDIHIIFKTIGVVLFPKGAR